MYDTATELNFKITWSPGLPLRFSTKHELAFGDDTKKIDDVTLGFSATSQLPLSSTRYVYIRRVA